MDELLTTLKVLVDVLGKKRNALDQILGISQNQEVILQSPGSVERTEFFNESNSEKQKLIDTVLECDDVFERFWGRVKDEMEGREGECKEHVKSLQELVSKVLELDVAIRAQELRNSTHLQPAANVRDGAKKAHTPVYRKKVIETINKHKKLNEQ